MKFKRIISFVTLIFVLCSSAVYAEAYRKNYRKEVEAVSRERETDILFEDFTSVAPGQLPSGVIVNSANEYGYTTSGIVDIGGGVEKNCMLLVDTKNTQDYAGPAFSVNWASMKGLVGIEVRLKFIKDEIPDAKDWATVLLFPRGTAGNITRLYAGSGSGRFVIHNGATAQSEFASTAVRPEEWWTVKFVIDTDNKKVDVQALHEPTGKLFQSFDQSYYPNDTPEDVTGIMIQTQVYSGTWAVDYVRLTEEKTRLMDQSESEDFERGCEQTLTPGPVSSAVSGRTNIMVDGIYKYTTKEPKLDGDNVLVTAKNIATFFDMAYYTDGDKLIMKNDDTEFEIAKDGSEIKKDGKAFTASASLIAEDKQVFVPIKDIAEALGYTYEYNSETNTAAITSDLSDEESGGDKASGGEAGGDEASGEETAGEEEA